LLRGLHHEIFNNVNHLAVADCVAVVPTLPALSGLISIPPGTHILTTTTVNLSRQNFKIVKTNAIGSSVGFSFLNLFTLKAPGYAEANTLHYQQIGVSEGKAQALIYVMHESSSTYFILSALLKITVCGVYRWCGVSKDPRCTDHSLKKTKLNIFPLAF
jgi:hypothetical protein